MQRIKFTELKDAPTNGRIILMNSQIIFPSEEVSFDLTGKVQDFLDKRCVTINGYELRIVKSNQGDPYRDGYAIGFYHPVTYHSASVFLEDLEDNGFTAIKNHLFIVG